MAHSLHPSDFGLPNDPAQPVLSALGRSFLDNLEECSTIVNEMVASIGQPVDEAYISRKMDSVVSCLKNASELGRWIYQRKALPTEEAFRKTQTLRELGNEYVTDMFKRLQKLPQGARPKRRQAYITGFEFMLQSKENSLGQAVRKFCPCGGKHERKCAQNFKAGIHNLTKLLRKYAPGLATRYDALHPDRAKKGR